MFCRRRSLENIDHAIILNMTKCMPGKCQEIISILINTQNINFYEWYCVNYIKITKLKKLLYFQLIIKLWTFYEKKFYFKG